MARKRFKETGMGSFFGDFVYERIVPRDHFLVKLNRVMDWEPFTEMLLPAYKGLAERGRPPYPPVVILKMLLISFLYGISERQVEEATNFNLAVKEFVGLAVDEAATDHSALSEFNRRWRTRRSIKQAGRSASKSNASTARPSVGMGSVAVGISVCCAMASRPI